MQANIHKNNNTMIKVSFQKRRLSFPMLLFFIFLFQWVNLQGQTTLIVTKIVDCNLHTTWKKWTTPNGICAFLGEDANIELKINGKFEVHNSLYNLHAKNCKILSYLPQEMLSFSWKPPSKFKYLEDKQHSIWVVVYFDAVNDSMTRVSIRQAGFGQTNAWKSYFKWSKSNWEDILNQLALSCKT